MSISSNNERIDKRKCLSDESIIKKIIDPKKILRNNTNFSHQHYKLYSQKALRHSDENQTVATLFVLLYSSPIMRTSGSNVTANFSLITA